MTASKAGRFVPAITTIGLAADVKKSSFVPVFEGSGFVPAARTIAFDMAERAARKSSSFAVAAVVALGQTP